jgi:hypothetical protein
MIAGPAVTPSTGIDELDLVAQPGDELAPVLRQEPGRFSGSRPKRSG